jgi:beta-galactosidase
MNKSCAEVHHMKNCPKVLSVAVTFVLGTASLQQCLPQDLPSDTPASPRERWSMDFSWRFGFGNATDPARDFDPANNVFTYFAKAGNGAGAAAADFDDRGWRTLNVPHDWAVEAPFDSRGSASHGYKAIGRNFPERSVGWYRKSFTIPETDLGRHITIEFDGVFRDSQVWINGFYLGREPSGYTGFSYDLTDYLNYGGANVIAVRVDASLEEGWFYEGAGIYRHVWLTKTALLHTGPSGVFVSSEVNGDSAEVTARATVNNDSTNMAAFDIEQTIENAEGQAIAHGQVTNLSLNPGGAAESSCVLTVSNPKLWAVETPYLYKLVTRLRQGGAVVDHYETPFGIRTVRWDANEGFFLNGKRVELKGTCNHQDHAGVGVAVPDELDVFRVEQLKQMGCNAIRTSHNPPAPELLDACDRLGMLVMDENRLTGTTPEVYSQLDRFMRRDRNHPCVIIWSLGNEEWNIEGTPRGTRITATMQAHARQMDPTRRFTAAISGGWGQGTSVSIDVMGFNYYTHGDNDRYHAQFPNKPSVATEDASTFSTRGIYVEDREHQHLTAYDANKPDWGLLAEESWPHYAARPYVAGLFQWTGFDYRGEETPFGWPAISSQFGILDTCGFPKDNFYYYQAWWSEHPVLHLLPHWSWPGMEGQDIDVWCQSNCEEVELFLNGQTQGRKKMKQNSHLQWNVKYIPGVLLARGYKNGQEILTGKIETTGRPSAIQLTPHRSTIKANGEDISVVTVQANDEQGRFVPIAHNEITFQIDGPGRIIGVGNGDPSSQEPDQYVGSVSSLPLTNWRMMTVDSLTNRPEVEFAFDDSGWPSAFTGGGGGRRGNAASSAQPTVYRGTFELPESAHPLMLTLELRKMADESYVYVNGRPLTLTNPSDSGDLEFPLDANILRPGRNVLAVVARAQVRQRNRNGGGHGAVSNPALIRVTEPAAQWKRSLFSGLAQVIVQSVGEPGEITLTAKSEGVTDGVLKLTAQSVALRTAY